jgi:hypothetical protein
MKANALSAEDCAIESRERTPKATRTLKILESLREIPVSFKLCGLDYLMKRQLWRLLDDSDLRGGRGLGFETEPFFLALRRLELSSTS